MCIKFPFNYLLSGLCLIFAACRGQGQAPVKVEMPNLVQPLSGSLVPQIDGEIRGIWQDSKNNLWFVSNGNGVFRYDGHDIVNFTTQHGLCSNNVWMVQEDKAGNIWFKTYLLPKGEIALCRFDGLTFESIRPESAVLNSPIQDGFLLCDYYLDGKTVCGLQLPHTSPIKNVGNTKYHYDIYATRFDRNGDAWFGTCMAGLCRYDGKAYTWFADTALSAPIRDIFEDRDGTLWVGNNGGGLFRFDGKNFINFSKAHHLDNPDFATTLTSKPGSMARIWKIAQDRQGNLWIATIDNGIWRYDGQNLTNYTTKDGLGTNAIWTLYVDKDDRLWVGTAETGVYFFDGKRFEQFVGAQ